MLRHTVENWVVAQLKPNSFQIADTNLLRQNIVHFCPRRMETKSRSNKLVEKSAALFPGYIFVQSSRITSQWRSINATRGITRLVVNDPRRPNSLPEAFMAGLIARCDETGLLQEAQDISPGDDVRIIAGPFADIVTRIERLEADARLQVLIEIMGQSTRVSVARSAVELVSHDK